MTAQRWWVKLFARWQARIDSVKGQIQAVSLAVTAFSTFSLVLQNAGLSRFVLPLGLILAICGPAYAYLFAEGGVWNQLNRDRADMAGNYAGPGGRINAELTALMVAAALSDDGVDEEDVEQAREVGDAVFQEYRDGITIDD